MPTKCADPSCDKPARMFSNYCEFHPVFEQRETSGYHDDHSGASAVGEVGSNFNPEPGSGGAGSRGGSGNW